MEDTEQLDQEAVMPEGFSTTTRLLHLVAQQHHDALARQTAEFEEHRRELSRCSPAVAEVAAARAEAARLAALAQVRRGA